MRFNCEFKHQDTGARKTIVASLSQAECQSIKSLRKHKGIETAEVTAEAYALRKAYAEVPDGFRHIQPPTVIRLS